MTDGTHLVSHICHTFVTHRMSMAHKNLKHTIVRNGTYYLNLRVQSCKNTFRRSLLTDSYKQARKLVAEVRDQMSETDSIITQERLNEIVDLVLQIEVNRAFYHSDAVLKVGSSPNKQLMKVWEREKQIKPKTQDFNKWVVDTRISKQSPSEHPMVKANLQLEHHLTQLTEITKNLGEVIKKADFPEAVKQAKTLKEMYSDILPDALKPADKVIINPIVQTTPDAPTMNELYEDYRKKWKMKEAQVRERTKFFKWFKLLIGDVPVNKVDKKMVGSALETISRFPKVAKPPYRQMTPEQLLEVAEDDTLPDEMRQGSNLSNAFKHLNTFWGWCIEEGYRDDRPSSNFKLPEHTRRGCFSYTQMRKMLEYHKYNTNISEKWAALIQMFTGCRNAEVQQLRKQDVVEDEDSGILYFRITKEAGSLKTTNSNRKIPLHQTLLDLGIMKWVDSCADGRLFEESINLTAIYNNTKADLSFPSVDQDGLVLTAYSTRHRMNTALIENSVHDLAIKSIIGHTNRDNGQTAHYSHVRDMSLLKEMIDRVDYL